jgi:ABC-type glycerol-3-phosphate transport system permease component
MASLTVQARPQTRTSSPRSRKRPWGRIVGDLFTYLFLIVAVVLTLYPLFWMIISSLKPAADILGAPLSLDLGHLSFSSYAALLSSIPIAVGFKNTLIVMIFKGGLTMFFCPLAGFAFAKFRFRGRDFLFSVILATFMLPFVVMIIPLFLEMGTLDWVNTFPGLILPGAVGAFGIFWMRQSIAEIPDELLDAGKVDGCSAFGLYWRIVVPIIRPALAALAILTFLGIYNDFIWPVIITNSSDMQTLQVMLFSLSSQINNAQPGLNGGNVWGEVMAAFTIATVPVLILFIAMQRQFIRGILAGGLKG